MLPKEFQNEATESESSCRTRRASHGRGSSLTLGKERFPMKITAGLKAAAKALVADPKAESFRAGGKPDRVEKQRIETPHV